MKTPLRIGTRGSPLALIQATDLKNKLLACHPTLASTHDIEIVPIQTSGDWKPENKDQRFIDMGGNKGYFTKEIEEALLSNYVDVAVHSMKDVASLLPDGLEIAAILQRQSPFDAFISTKYKSLESMPAGSRIGTSSLRRQAQLLHARPDLTIVPLRGNVETRLTKLEAGQAEATILAVAGLSRLDMQSRVTETLPASVMLPAGGQGAVGVEIRRNDDAMRNLLAPLNHQATSLCVTAERAMLRILDGNCTTPIASFATIDAANILTLEGLVAKPDGSAFVKLSISGSPVECESIGNELGMRLKGRLPADFFAA